MVRHAREVVSLMTDHPVAEPHDPIHRLRPCARRCCGSSTSCAYPPRHTRYQSTSSFASAWDVCVRFPRIDDLGAIKRLHCGWRGHARRLPQWCAGRGCPVAHRQRVTAHQRRSPEPREGLCVDDGVTPSRARIHALAAHDGSLGGGGRMTNAVPSAGCCWVRPTIGSWSVVSCRVCSVSYTHLTLPTIYSV